jgi:T5SS/PEP-CTERM-associated repeat protein
MKTKDWFSRFHLIVVRRQRPALLFVSLVALDMILAGIAFGADWTGAASTDWFTGSNCVNGVSPTANNTAILRTNSPHTTIVGRPGAMANQLTVGESPSLPSQSGVGSLTIQSGGVLSVGSANAFIGRSKEGTVTVTGSASILNISSNLFVGGSNGGPGGTGLLEITNGGTVNATAVTIWKTGTLAVKANFTLNTPSLTVDGGTIRTLANTTFPNSAPLAAGGVILDSNGF